MSVLRLCLIDSKVSERANPPPQEYTFGYQRATLLGAFFNGVFLLALGVSILVQAIERFTNITREYSYRQTHSLAHISCSSCGKPKDRSYCGKRGSGTQPSCHVVPSRYECPHVSFICNYANEIRSEHDHGDGHAHSHSHSYSHSHGHGHSHNHSHEHAHSVDVEIASTDSSTHVKEREYPVCSVTDCSLFNTNR